MAQNTVHYTIAHRRPDGRPDFVYPWDGKLAACVLSSINICRGMLQYPKIRAAFLSFAREFNRTHQGAWYHDPRHKFETMEGVISAFLKAILKSFPIVYVDDGINNPGCLAAHPRQEWDGIFQPRDQSILVNGSVWERYQAPRDCVQIRLTIIQRVRDMVAAMTRAEQTNDPNDHEHKRFRSFNFIFANTFLHEIGHVFLTFLTKGRTVTPCHINAEVVGYSGEHRGEAGRNLETIILGGTLEYYRDHTDDDSQVLSHYRSLLSYTAALHRYQLTVLVARGASSSHQGWRPPNLTRVN